MSPRWSPVRAALESSPAHWSVRVTGAQGGGLFAHDPGRMLRTASLGKLILLLAAAQAIETGRLNPDERLRRSAATRVDDSGVWQHLSIDQLPVTDVARLIGLSSDNWATNVLLERLGGVDEVARTAEGIGIHDIRLLDRVRDERGTGVPETLSVGSAAAYADFFLRLPVGGPVLSRVTDWLGGGFDLSMVGSAFGLDPLSHGDDPSLELVSKTGTDAGIRADAGFVRMQDRTIVYACIANWKPDDGVSTDEILAVMREVGRAIRAELS